MADIFLSYSSEDRERVRALVNALERQGWSVWWDRRIQAGKSWNRVIEQALDEAKCVVVVWSQNSIQSEWVFNEAEEGKTRQVLVPVLIDNVRPPLGFRHIHAVRLIGWQGESSHPEFISLVESIKATIGQAEPVYEFIWQSPPSQETPVAELAKPAPKTVAEKHEPMSMTAPLQAKLPEGGTTNTMGNGFTDDLNGVKLEMVYVPGGNFTMGSEKHDRERPPHEVTVPSFYCGKFLVTQAQWKAVMGDELKPHFKGDDNLPMENISWDDAKKFCQKLQELTKKAYRLPSEAEWEYACRAGTTTDFAFGNSLSFDQANFQRNYYSGASSSDPPIKTTPVGSFQPNAFKLYDMHGNIWEWCEDVWHANYQKAPTDGSAWLDNGDSSHRVLRGGAWNCLDSHCRSAYRLRFISNDPGGPKGPGADMGFRVAVSARTQ